MGVGVGAYSAETNKVMASFILNVSPRKQPTSIHLTGTSFSTLTFCCLEALSPFNKDEVSHTDHVPLEAMNVELSRQESVSRL